MSAKSNGVPISSDWIRLCNSAAQKLRSRDLWGGLTIEIREGVLQQTLRIEQTHEPVFPLTSKFFLSGSAKVETPRIKEI